MVARTYPGVYTPPSRVGRLAPPAAAQPAPPARQIRSTLVLPFVLALLLLVGTTAYGLLRPGTHVHPPAPGSTGALVWGDGIFAKRVELKAWLALHGASYDKWRQTHPAALRLLPKTPPG
jgi:hypothetical protein